MSGKSLFWDTTIRGNKYYAFGKKYNMKKTISFVATEKAGHTEGGTYMKPDGLMIMGE